MNPILKRTPIFTCALLIIVLTGMAFYGQKGGETKSALRGESTIVLMTKYARDNFKAAAEIAVFNFHYETGRMSDNHLLSKKLSADRSNYLRNKFVGFVKGTLNKTFAAFSVQKKEGAQLATAFPAVLEENAEATPQKENDFSCDFGNFKKTYKGTAALMSFVGGETDAFAYNTEKRWPIASVSKLMSAIVIEEKMDLTQKIKMSESAVMTYGVSGEFSVKEVFSLRDLVVAGLVVSSNDAIQAAAEAYGFQAFIDEMQKKAKELGMYDTTYFEPTGLSYVNQSTASDLKKLAEYIFYNHPEILKISSQKYADITELSTLKKRRLYNVDRFAGDTDFLGGKTGFIDEAGRNLVAFFSRDGAIILTIVLGTDDSFGATDELLSYLKTCRSGY